MRVRRLFAVSAVTLAGIGSINVGAGGGLGASLNDFTGAELAHAAGPPLRSLAAQQTYADDYDYVRPTPGPRGAITVIGDSVLVGAGWEPGVATRLAEQGWGPIWFRAKKGYSTGRQLPTGHAHSAAAAIRANRDRGWDPPSYLVNLGANDVGLCLGGMRCLEDNIRFLLDAIGPDRQVLWPMITHVVDVWASNWNQALLNVAAERPNLRVWDWPAARIANGIPIANDNTHLPHAAAYTQRSSLMASETTAQIGQALPDSRTVGIPGAAAAASGFIPISPQRVFDSRRTGTPVAADSTTEIDLSAFVPAGSVAVSVNLTVDGPMTDGWLTAHPCRSTRPWTSNVNFAASRPRGAHAVVAVSTDRALCVYSSATTQLIVDVQGAFTPGGAQRFTPITPNRSVDTRNSGRRSVVEVATPAGAVAVALNLTATGASSTGWLTAYPCGSREPVVSSVNFVAFETVAGAAYVPTGTGGKVCVSSSTSVDVVVDVMGVFSPAGSYRFVPASPRRMLDTRSGDGGWRGYTAAQQQIDISVAPDGAGAVTGTLTMVSPHTFGWITAFPCDQSLPPTSNVNAVWGAIAPNSVTVALGDEALCLSTSTRTYVLFDTTGWWVE